VAALRGHDRRHSGRCGVSAIADYLEQLERELRVKRAPRRRLLAEAADHLRASADEIAASGVARDVAEEEAVARFGAAALVARRFAHSAASASARNALVWAVTACAGYAVAAAFFVLSGPVWLRDFPQGAPSMLALQVALVALVLAGLRALRFRTTPLTDELRLRLVANGVAIAATVVAAAAGAELLLALTRPAAAPWGDAAGVIAIYSVAGAAALVASFVAVATAARARALAGLPRPSGDELLLSRPALACAAVAALAFVAMTVVDAAATGLFEAAAVVAAYLTLGRALGLRAPRREIS
jgi:hypothetical protein